MDSRVVGMTARWEMHYAQFTELRSRWTSEGGRMAPTEVRSAAADASGSPILHRRHTLPAHRLPAKLLLGRPNS